jgi:ADP-ribose pyrophosphatase
VKRELREETGSEGKQYFKLGEIFPSPGYTNERLHLYACRIDSTGKQDLDEDEFLEVEKIPLEKAKKMVEQGKIPDAKTQILILRVLTLLRDKKI